MTATQHQPASSSKPWLVAVAAGAALAIWLFGFPLAAQLPKTEVRGITVSTHTSNRGWETDELAATFADIAKVGANWVAIHPYARISDDGEVSFQPFVIETAAVINGSSEASTAPLSSGSPGSGPQGPRYLRGPIREAQRLGLQILIKPHLAYWGSGFSWRGDIEFESEAQWQRFFSSYQLWIEAIARATTDANGFVIGTELDKTVHRKEWRKIISRFRELSGVPVTYAANWTDYQRVPFWKQLDVIGAQAYFPIAGESPSDDDLERGWRRRMEEITAFARKLDKQVVFTELGYDRSLRAAIEPWRGHERQRRVAPKGTTNSPGTNRPGTNRPGTDSSSAEDRAAEALQSQCLSAALRAIEGEPLVLGAFLWKWFPRPRSVGRDFQMAAPAIQEVIREHWQPTLGRTALE